MLASDRINITVGLAEAVRTGRVTPRLVADAVLLIHPRVGRHTGPSPVELALKAGRAMARAS